MVSHDNIPHLQGVFFLYLSVVNTAGSVCLFSWNGLIVSPRESAHTKMNIALSVTDWEWVILYAVMQIMYRCLNPAWMYGATQAE
jgi:hypothetical protein